VTEIAKKNGWDVVLAARFQVFSRTPFSRFQRIMLKRLPNSVYRMVSTWMQLLPHRGYFVDAERLLEEATRRADGLPPSTRP
jgi:hypothetical protein